MHEEPYRRIPLLSAAGETRGYVTVDEADAEWLSQWTWRLAARYYAGRNEWVKGTGRSQLILMHRALLGLRRGDPRQVDHVNRDKLDNRRSNLRIVTPAQQSQNRPSPRHARSCHRGVTWCSDRQQWRAAVTVNGRVYYGRRTSDELEAAAEAVMLRQRHMTHAEG